MVPVWLQALAWAWLTACGVCALVIAVDLFRSPQKMPVMNVVWPVNALYLGPIALVAYQRIGRLARRTGAKDPEVSRHKPFWQTVFVADTHCGAGCTLGDIAAEWFVFLAAIKMGGNAIWPDLIFDFSAAYLLGIIFQFLTIAPMRGLHGWEGVKAALKADTLSLISFEVGLFGWMLLTRFVFFRDRPLEPTEATYWFMMQIGMCIGFLTSYPVNWWLVRAKLKEAM